MNRYRQPHLPRLVPDLNRANKRVFAFPAIVTDIAQSGRTIKAQGEEIGPIQRVRLAHASLDKRSGSVKFPAKPEKQDGKFRDVPSVIAIPMHGRVEDAVIIGFFDRRTDADVLVRIAEYMKANPNHEFPWIDRHPSGPEMKYDGHGSWSMETPSGHTIKLIERDGEESIEVLTADGKPLTLRARGDGTVLVHSDSGDVEVIAGGSVKLTAKNVEIVAEESTEIKAIKDAGIIGKNVDILASEDASIAATGDVNIGASGSIAAIAGSVKLGDEALVKKLITEVFIDLFNTHTHGGVTPGAGIGGPPSIPLTEAQVATANTEAS